MARKHSKQGVIKQPVVRTSTVLSAGKTERKVVENPVTKQFEVVTVVTHSKITSTQGKAMGSTRRRGEKNTPTNMVKKGSTGEKK